MSKPPEPPALDLLDVVGRTPLVELKRLSPKPGRVRIFAKLEGQNPSGSVKDRLALALVEAAERRGRIRPGDTLVEASSGNTGIALAMVARRKGYHLHVVLPKAVAPSIADVLRLYGVDSVLDDRCEDMRQSIDYAERLERERGWFAVRQFEDPGNVEIHYRTTGPEILAALPEVDVFVAGIGTAGTVMGVGRRLREACPNARIVGVDPKPGAKLQGLPDIEHGFRPPLLDLQSLDARWLVDAPSAVNAAARVLKEEGINAGISAGAALHAGLKEAARMERGNVVVMFSDGAWKYLPARPWDAAAAQHEDLDDVHWW
jgi:cysteine synthase B